MKSRTLLVQILMQKLLQKHCLFILVILWFVASGSVLAFDQEEGSTQQSSTQTFTIRGPETEGDMRLVYETELMELVLEIPGQRLSALYLNGTAKLSKKKPRRLVKGRIILLNIRP